jgi:hypothetical protein
VQHLHAVERIRHLAPAFLAADELGELLDRAPGVADVGGEPALVEDAAVCRRPAS